MANQKVIAAIDIGTDKCATVIGVVDGSTNKPRIVGVAATPSSGVKRSQIVDLEQVIASMTRSLDAAERMAGLEIKTAFLSTSGSHIKSQNSKGVVAVASPNQEIAADDVNRVIEAARAVSLPSDREIIHAIPKSFKIDSQEGIKDPVGMTGVRLETETHIITGLTTALKNMEKCVYDLGVEAEGFIFSGLAASEIILSETEKELGVVAVDLGAGSTSIAVWVDGALEFSTSLPIGARHITQDIALGCRLSLNQAEKLKVYLSQHQKEIPHALKANPGETKAELAKRRRKVDEINLLELNISDEREVLSKKKVVEGIIYPRLKEIMAFIGESLEKHGLFNQVPAGLVFTGGGAQTIGLTHMAKQVLGLPARIGQLKPTDGLTNDIYDPSLAVAIGLIHYGFKHGGGSEQSGFNFGKLTSWISLSSIKNKLERLLALIVTKGR